MTSTLGTNWQSLLADLKSGLPPIDRRLAKRLPVIPANIQLLSKLAADPDTPASRVASLIESDGTFTTMLLKFANSAAVAARSPVRSVQHAIATMGFRRLTNAVLCLSFQQAFNSARSQLINMARFRHENNERSAFASEMAAVMNCNVETVHMASLLQDLLLPVLTDVWPDAYRSQRSEMLSLSEFERQRFGWDHGLLTAALMSEWSFPPELVVCVAQHHRFDHFTEQDLQLPKEIVSVAGASLIPEQMNQTADVSQKLLRLQKSFPSINVLEIASEASQRIGQITGHGTNLCDRLASLLTATLVEDQFQSMMQERTIGRYTIESKLGRGAMGTVFKARHDMLRRPAAIKVLDTRRLSDQAVKRFEAEVQLTSQLMSRCTITIYDYGMTPEGFFYYVMEYVDGVTLKQLVHELGPLPERRAVNLLLQACESLAEAHSRALIHRDIKPDNIMVRTSGIAGDALTVLDFGLATVLSGEDAQHWGPDDVGGTPLYLAPEAILTPAEVDARVDVYALGAVAYFLLTGMQLFEAEHDDLPTLLKRQIGEIPALPSKRSGRRIHAELESLVMQCLAKPRDERPASIQEIAERLSALVLDSPANESAPSGTTDSDGTVRRPPTAVFAHNSGSAELNDTQQIFGRSSSRFRIREDRR